MSKFSGKRIGVIMGGPSSEREVSLNSGRGILAALRQKGYDAVAIDWKGGRPTICGAQLRREKIDVAWIALHGTYGEDGCVQGLLECYQVPYTGSGVLASALAMDKVATRRIFDQESIESPRWRRYHGPADVARIGFPLVVKPSSEGSSVGVSIVKDQAELPAALDAAQQVPRRGAARGVRQGPRDQRRRPRRRGARRGRDQAGDRVLRLRGQVPAQRHAVPGAGADQRRGAARAARSGGARPQGARLRRRDPRRSDPGRGRPRGVPGDQHAARA